MRSIVRSSLVLGFLICRSESFLSRQAISSPVFRSRSGRLFSTTSNDEKKVDSGHQSTMSAPQLSAEDEKMLSAFREHQSKAARISMAEEVRTLIDRSLCYGVLSTNSDQYPGYPTGSVVGFELDEAGLPFFVFSSMSAHTKDVLKDGKVSLTVLASDFKGAAEGRVVLIGNVKKVFDKEKIVSLREKYLSRHKDAYWIDFGDFTYFAMDKLETVRFVGGFAMAGSVTAQEYSSSKPDPIAAFSTPVMKHMNDDHADSTVLMVKHYTGLVCSGAEIVSMDRLGMTVKAKLEVAGGGYTKVRLPYPRPVTERKAIKEVLVEMTKASALPPQSV